VGVIHDGQGAPKQGVDLGSRLIGNIGYSGHGIPPYLRVMGGTFNIRIKYEKDQKKKT
jgi:hypothetical protein